MKSLQVINIVGTWNMRWIGYFTPAISSVGEEHAIDVDRSAKIDRPPRVNIKKGVDAAVVHSMCRWVLVTVDCLPWQVLATKVRNNKDT